MKTQISGTIGEDEEFYGYLIGLSVGFHMREDCLAVADQNLYAIFCYNQKLSVWIVPDIKLFQMLWPHLKSMAWERKNADSFGMDKLWIMKSKGKWVVNLP